ncbi:hypothetical protein BDF22DRAFT_746413 [Syncephalis plumigaleata]|nr:hypothetical protein BDF22DRAFT_746413 [Syncephalis plumigaleata]
MEVFQNRWKRVRASINATSNIKAACYSWFHSIFYIHIYYASSTSTLILTDCQRSHTTTWSPSAHCLRRHCGIDHRRDLGTTSSLPIATQQQTTLTPDEQRQAEDRRIRALEFKAAWEKQQALELKLQKQRDERREQERLQEQQQRQQRQRQESQMPIRQQPVKLELTSQQRHALAQQQQRHLQQQQQQEQQAALSSGLPQ